jgi:Leucine-rich repeat (LRR) protein
MTTEIETYLNSLSEDILKLNISSKGIKSLPDLTRFKNLEELDCSNNQLTSLPTLPKNLKELYCYNNPIYKIVNGASLFQIKKNVQIINNFRNLYYCLKFKKQFRKWLWEKVREPSAKKLYNPIYLIENLGDEDDLDTFLNNWEIINNRRFK